MTSHHSQLIEINAMFFDIFFIFVIIFSLIYFDNYFANFAPIMITNLFFLLSDILPSQSGSIILENPLENF